MKKRIAIVLLVLAIIPATLAASTPIFQLGPYVAYNKTVVDVKDEGVDVLNLQNLSFGADIRINPGKWFSIDIPATLGFGVGSGEKGFSIGVIPTLNLNIPVYITDGIGLDIAIGAGTQFEFVNADKQWTMNGFPFSNAGEAFSGMNLVYRAGVTLNLTFIGISVNAVVPCEGPFSSDDIGDIFTPGWESTRFSAAVLFNFG